MPDPSTNNNTAAPEPKATGIWLPRLRKLARIAGWSTLALTVVVVIACMAVNFGILPRIDDFRPSLEKKASDALGLNVQIGKIILDRSGWRPAVSVNNVRFIDKKQQEGLHIEKIEARASWVSLIRGRVSHLAIITPTIHAKRDAKGNIYFAGIPLQQQEDNSQPTDESAIQPVLNLLLKQKNLEIRNGSISWTDALREAEPLSLTQIHAQLKNTRLHHALTLSMTPPAQWGKPIVASAHWKHSVLRKRSEWDYWSGTLQTHLNDVDVSHLPKYVDFSKHVSLQEGQGSVGVQVNFHNTFRDIALNLQLHALRAHLGKNLPPLVLQDLNSLFHVQFDKKQNKNSYTLKSKNLSFTTATGLRWTGGNISVNYQDAQDPAQRSGSIQGNAWDIDIISQIASSLPLGESTSRALLRYKPQGKVGELHVNWQGDINAPTSYTARGHVNGISWLSQPGQASADRERSSPPIGVPGISGANIRFDFNQDGGKMNLQLNKGSAEFPGVFENPKLAFDDFQTQLVWRIKDQQIDVELPQLQFGNADVQGDVRIHWKTYEGKTGVDRFPGTMHLEGTLKKTRAEKVVNYLPLSIGREALDYVGNSVRSGDIRNAKVLIQGDLDEIPFSKNAQGVRPEGEFRFDVPLSNAEFAFVPRYLQHANEKPWPTLQQLNGRLLIDKDTLSVTKATARFSTAPDVSIHDLAAYIPRLGDNLVVGLAAKLRGDMNQTIQVANQSPLSDLLGNSLEKTTASGIADMSLTLGLPVMHMDKAQVKGHVQLNNNEIRMSPDSPLLTQSQGQITFNEYGFTLKDVTAAVMGGKATLEGGTSTTKPGQKQEVLIKAKGNFTGEGLLKETALGSIARLGQFLRGSSRYDADIHVRNGILELTIDSDLVGMGMHMPAPLGKTAEAKLPFHYSTKALAPSQNAGATTQITEDEMNIRFGDKIYAQYVRDISGTSGKGEAPVKRGRVAIGALAVEDPLPMPTDGVHALVQIEKLDADGWMQIIDATWGLQDSPVDTERKLLLASEDSTNVSNHFLPDQIMVRTPLLTFYNRDMELLVADGQRKGRLWSFDVTSRHINGKVEYLQSASSGVGSVKARLSHLIINQENTEEVIEYVQKTADPQTLPYLDINVQEVEFLGYKLNNVIWRASNNAKPRPAGADLQDENTPANSSNAWHIHELRASLPNGHLRANGVWAISRTSAEQKQALQPHELAQRFVSLHVNFQTDNFGNVLDHLGQKGLASGGEGSVTGAIHWAGSPVDVDFESMDGNLTMDMRNGYMSKVDTGAAKLISMFSLQGLARLNQISGQGLGFDHVHGSLHIDKGIAKTSNLAVNGLVADLKVNGQADLVKQTVDMHVLAQPKINLNTASVVATAINPLVGVGSYFAQLLLSKSLSSAATQVMHVHGPFADLNIDKLKGQEARDISDRILKGHNSRQPINEWWNWQPISNPTIGTPAEDAENAPQTQEEDKANPQADKAHESASAPAASTTPASTPTSATSAAVPASAAIPS